MIMRTFKLIASNELNRHISILFSGAMVVHVLNTVYQMAVSRALPKEEYALLAAFLGMLVIIQRPISTLTATLSHYSSLMTFERREGDVFRLARKWGLRMGGAGLMLAAATLIFRAELAEMFHLSRDEPVIIAALTLPALFMLPALNGTIQGLQRFGWNIGSGISGAVARVTLGAGFVWFVHPACGWAMLGHGLGAYVSTSLLGLGILYVTFKGTRTATKLPSMRHFITHSFFIQMAYAVLMTADVILVKHFFPEQDNFAFAATLGRLVIFLPGSIVTAMFPKVAAEGKTSHAQNRVFFHSLGLTGACVLISITSCLLFPGLLTHILFGMPNPSASTRLMIASMAIAMGLSAMLNVTMLFMIAQRAFKPAMIVIACALAYLAIAILWHPTIWHIIFASALANGSAFLALLACLILRLRAPD